MEILFVANRYIWFIYKTRLISLWTLVLFYPIYLVIAVIICRIYNQAYNELCKSVADTISESIR